MSTVSAPKYSGFVETGPMLDTCCESEAPALVISTVLAQVAHGVFRSVSPDGVSLQLQENVQFRPHSMCCVSFAIEQKAHIFMATAVTCEDSILKLELPDHITAAEMRSTFRVPVVDSKSVSTEVKFDGATLHPELVDISLNGVCLRFPSNLYLPSVYDVVEVRLTNSKYDVTLMGEVRNLRGTNCGIMFPEAMRGTQIEPPENLRKLVKQLEQQYLRNRKCDD